MSTMSLADAITAAPSAVALLRNAQAAPFTFPVAAEFSNWRSEQHAWRDTCVLFDQSHHMTDLFIEGPDAIRLLSELGVNNFSRYTVDRGKQFVAVNHDGHLIGDGILFYLGRDSLDLVGHATALNWVQFHAEHGGYDVRVERDENSAMRAGGPPVLFRYELQGPTAGQIVQRLTGRPLPEVKFFGMTRLRFAGLEVRALRHGMAGQPGFELFGPWEHEERVRQAILDAGQELGLVAAGALAYSTSNLESGWVPTPLPAIFTGGELEGYRRWLPAAAAGSLGGSYRSEQIADYYLTPYDLGYGGHVAFDHDFVGREALLRHQQEPARTKVTLVWNPDDVAAALGSLLADGPKAKYIQLPKARYALYQVDAVLAGDELAGFSLDCGYIANESAFVSLATVDRAHETPGTQLTVLWGEEPNSTKPQVEPHQQREIRATVAPVPYVDFARTSYRAPTLV